MRSRWSAIAKVGAAMSGRDSILDEIEHLFATRGGLYYGEGVNQSEHALQAAELAEKEGAPPALIVAALLHDIGHLLDKHDEDAAERGIDTRHEAIGGGWLKRHFGPEVTEPVRLHVDAKRYRCAVDAAYHDRLSDASKLSLSLQGGPMSSDEADAFLEGPFAQDALRLRLWDEEAKVVGCKTPDFGHFRPLVSDVLAAR